MESDWMCSVCDDDIVELNQVHSSEPYAKNGLACYPCFIETVAPIRLTIWEMITSAKENQNIPVDKNSQWDQRIKDIAQKAKTTNKEIFDKIFNEKTIMQLRQDYLDSKNKDN